MRSIMLSAMLMAGIACGSDPTTSPRAQLEPGDPAGWTSQSSGPGLFEVGLDARLKRTGTASAYLRSLQMPLDDTAYVTLTQNVRADAFRGMRLRYSGYLRPTNLGRPGGALWLRVDGPGTIPAFDNMPARSFGGTSDWQLASIVADIPTDAIGISFGIVLNGSGELRADDLRFDIASASTPLTAAPFPDASAYDSATAVAFYATMPTAPVNMDFESRDVIPLAARAQSHWTARSHPRVSP
jgi:hypothetical protein